MKKINGVLRRQKVQKLVSGQARRKPRKCWEILDLFFGEVTKTCWSVFVFVWYFYLFNYVFFFNVVLEAFVGGVLLLFLVCWCLFELVTKGQNQLQVPFAG